MDSSAPVASGSGSRPLYQESSQFRHWRFSPAKLAGLRRELNTRAVAVVKDNMRAEAEAAKELSVAEGKLPEPALSTASSSSSTPAPPAIQDLSTVPYLEPADELLLIRYYSSTIPRTCAGFGFPEAIEATATSYFKRFYLWNTTMDYHPRKVMPTCLFLALKTENTTIPLGDFVKRFSKLSEDDLLALEFTLAQSLKFEFTVWHAHKALRGFLLDFQSVAEIDHTDLVRAVADAQPYIASSRQTDLELLYAPSQIALACLSLAAPSLVATYLKAKHPGLEGQLERDRLQQIIQDVGREIVRSQGESVDMTRVKEIDRRLRTCSNPEKIPGSALYRKRVAQDELEEATKRAAKQLRDEEAKARDAAVFGGSLIPIPPAADGVGGGVAGTGLFDLAQEKRVPLSPRPAQQNDGGVARPVVDV